MKKSTLSLIAAGALAIGAIAQAENAPYGNGTVWVDTTVLGAGPSTVIVPVEQSVYVQPGWSDSYQQRHQAAATFNTPARAGEASTMTGGVPNLSTDNQSIAYDIPVPIYSVPSY
jgi:hypothetical protein